MDHHRGTYGEPSGEPQTPGHTSGAPKSHDARDALHKWLNSGVDQRVGLKGPGTEAKANLTMGLVAVVIATSDGLSSCGF